MRKFAPILLMSFIFLSSYVTAHPTGHEKPQTITKEQAITKASYQVKSLIEKGELEKSWGMFKVSGAVFERRDSRMNWIVSFTEQNQTDDKKTLFIFLTNTGYYLSTSFNKN